MEWGPTPAGNCGLAPACGPSWLGLCELGAGGCPELLYVGTLGPVSFGGKGLFLTSVRFDVDDVGVP